ncbi:hypothetical protein B0H16DRAFT_1721174 [Mycena metata]|uniref:CxC2-like cysteine cluster KDZ transposase-associated domain-containing protein n=1 Tax=Mycena metata TaxID=1033252 RepID=A0AAD7J9N7_9AGAR|nr:hypothetical protein B0H16DRAFT_1721174 [Mycena metata]
MPDLQDLNGEESDTVVASSDVQSWFYIGPNGNKRAILGEISSATDTGGDENQPATLGENQPRTLTEIDTADDNATHCDICQNTLGPQAHAGTRAFRCHTCVLSIQCEMCCSQSHLIWGSPEGVHALQEWDNAARKWGPFRTIADLMSSMTKLCGACNTILAGPYTMLPVGTVMCLDCGPRLFCADCCKAEHEMRPLHITREWELDGGWRAASLAELGMEYHFGHNRRPCVWPMEPVAVLMVIAENGLHKIMVKYCGCGGFERGALGWWRQIEDMGWYRAGIISSAICSTFPS